MSKNEDFIEVLGARVHNLKDIDVKIPREKLVVITGLSGSGKSSLAFDTIYAEGQRRYIETFSAYARQFLGSLERPDVDKINGLSPVIAIEQKTTSKNPRSTVGTITEIYDFMRLLYARASDAYSYNTGEKMISYTDAQIKDLILSDFENRRINILAPVIRARKGHYRELFQQIAKQGFVKVRVDGEIKDITPGMKLDRYKTHDIEIVIDRLVIPAKDETSEKLDKRLTQSIQTAMNQGNDILMVLEQDTEEIRFFSRSLMCPTSGISYPTPDPNNFSFNSPKGMCPKCKGLGKIHEIDEQKIIPDSSLSILKGALAPYGVPKKNWIFKQLELIAERYQFKLSDSYESIPEEAKKMILYGGNEKIEVTSKELGITRSYNIDFEGIANFIERTFIINESSNLKRWAKDYMNKISCPECGGSRLRKESLYFKINEKNIAELASMDVLDLSAWFADLPSKMTTNQLKIASEVIKEVRTRLQFLIDVGLTYLSLN